MRNVARNSPKPSLLLREHSAVSSDDDDCARRAEDVMALAARLAGVAELALNSTDECQVWAFCRGRAELPVG